MDWYEAVDYCESNFGNSYLADVLDQETQDFIDSEYLQTYPSVSYWLGGNDITNVSHQRIHNSILYSHRPSFIYSCSIGHIWEHEFCHLGSLGRIRKFLKRRNFCLSMLLFEVVFSTFYRQKKIFFNF